MKFATPIALVALMFSIEAKVTTTKRTDVKCVGSSQIICSQSELLDVTVTKDACED